MTETNPHHPFPDAEHQRASARRYSSEFTGVIVDVGAGRYALYANDRRTLLAVGHGAEIISAFANRPPYTPPARPSKASALKLATENIGKLLGL